jgi:hypothetical protein
MSMDNYISVQMTLASPTVTVAGFGLVLIAGTTGFPNASTDLIRFYTSLTAVATDFTSTTPEYLAAQAAFGQNPQPAQIAIGKVPAPVAGVMTLTFSAATVTGNVINGQVNGTAVGPITWATSDAATLTAVAAAIAAVPGVASATVAGEVITVTGAVGYSLTLSGFAVTGGASQPNVAIATTTPAVTWSAGLAAIRAVNDTWYGLVITDRTAGAILDVAAWAEANPIKFGAVTGDANVLTTATNDVASQLMGKSCNNTILLYHAISTEYPGAAWLCEMLSYPAGSANWMFKTLASITPDALTATQRTNALAKNCNLYTAQSGVNMTEPGKAASGQYADVLVGEDWFKANLKADVFALLTTTPKIPYTDAGVAMLEAAMRTRVKLGIDQGIIDGSRPITYKVPKVADQSTTDRAKRNFPGITGQFYIAGAIDTVGYAFTLSV